MNSRTSHNLSERTRRFGALLPPGLIVVLGMGFAILPLLRGRLFFYWDNAQQYFVQTAFLRQGLRAGHIPHWWAAVGSGVPTIGEGQSAHFNPIRLLLAWLLPTPVAFMVEFALYFAIAGVSTYAFLRQLRLHRDACLVGGIAHMFCSFALIYTRNVALHRSFVFVPLAFFLAERFVRTGRIVPALWVCPVVGLQLTTGHPTFAVITAVATAAYIGLRHALGPPSSLGSRSTSWRAAAISLATWTGCVLVGVGIAAVQVAPMLAHVEESFRAGGLSFDYAVNRLATSIRYFGTALFPFAYRQGDWVSGVIDGDSFNVVPVSTIYVGLLPVLMAVLALRSPPRRARLVWAVGLMGAFALALSLGGKTPLYPALWTVPGLSGMRYPSRFLLVVCFALASLAALGYHDLLVRSRARGAARGGRWTLPVLALAGAALSALLIVAEDLFASLVPVAESFRTGILISVVLMAGSLALAAAVLRTRGRSVGVRALVVGFLVLDLMSFRSLGGYARTVSADLTRALPAAVQAMERDGSRFRIMALIPYEGGRNRNEDIFAYTLANTTALWGVESTAANLSLLLKRYYAVHESIVWELINSPEAAQELASFLGFLNVRYVVGPVANDLAGWPVEYQDERTKMWSNPSFFPRVRLVGSLVPERIETPAEWWGRALPRLGTYYDMVQDWSTRVEDAAIVDNLLAGDVDFSTTAIVAEPLPTGIAGHDSTATVTPVLESSDAEEYEVVTGRRELMVISNNFYPGWTATVDGEPARIHRVNYVGMGVAVPAGRSVVRLTFRTPGFDAGLMVSAVTILLWLSAIVLTARARRRAANGYAGVAAVL